MPKQTFKLLSFEGGFNDAFNSRDIPDNSFQDIVNADITTKGIFTTIGQLNTHYSPPKVTADTSIYFAKVVDGGASMGPAASYAGGVDNGDTTVPFYTNVGVAVTDGSTALTATISITGSGAMGEPSAFTDTTGYAPGDTLYYYRRMTGASASSSTWTMANHGLSVGNEVYEVAGATVYTVSSVTDANTFVTNGSKSGSGLILIDRTNRATLLIHQIDGRTCANALLTNGWGLYTFSNDYSMGAGTFNEQDDTEESTNISNTSTDFICINNGASLEIFDPVSTGSTANWITASTLKLGTDDTGVQATYFYTNSGLRISDSNAANWASNFPRTLKHMQNTLFQNQPGVKYDVNAWVFGTQEIRSPLRGLTELVADATATGRNVAAPEDITEEADRSGWTAISAATLANSGTASRGSYSISITSTSSADGAYIDLNGTTYLTAGLTTGHSYVVRCKIRHTGAGTANGDMNLRFADNTALDNDVTNLNIFPSSGATPTIIKTHNDQWYDVEYMFTYSADFRYFGVLTAEGSNYDGGVLIDELSFKKAPLLLASVSSTDLSSYTTADLDAGQVVIAFSEDTSSQRDVTAVYNETTLEASITSASGANITGVPEGYTVFRLSEQSTGLAAGQEIEINGSNSPAFNGFFELLSAPVEVTVSSVDYTFITVELDTGSIEMPDGFVSTGSGFLGAACKLRKVTDTIDALLKSKWMFGISWVYDDVQESPISVCYGTNGYPMTASNSVDLTGFIDRPAMNTLFINDDDNHWNTRVVGFRIWGKDVISGKENTDWTLFKEVDFVRGNYTVLAGDGVPTVLTYGGTTDDTQTSGAVPLTEFPVDTFKSLNGYDPEVVNNAHWKTAVVANNKCYIGNVKVGESTYPDRMMVSPTGMYDIFPDDGFHFIDAVIADGDEIVHMEYLGGRIYQFKKRKLFVINVENTTDEFLEAEYPNMGVLYPTNVFKAENGIFWANENGIFRIAVGGAPENLIQNKLDIDAFTINQDNKPAPIGFDEVSKKTIIQTIDLATLINGGFVYDNIHNAFVKGLNIFHMPYQTGYAIKRSNMIMTQDRKLVQAVQLDATADSGIMFFEWDNTPQTLSGLQIATSSQAVWYKVKTKEFDLGEPSLRKKIYKVYITYQSTGSSNIKVLINSTDMDVNKSKFAGTTTACLGSNLSLATTGGDYKTAELIPDDRSELNNIYTFTITAQHIGTTSDSTDDEIPDDFAVNDITVVYRVKAPR